MRREWIAGLLLAIVLWLAAACAGPAGTGTVSTREPAADRRGEELIRSLTGPSAEPSSVKGIGELRLRTPSGVRIARLAWIVARGGRLRLEVLGPGGQSVLSLATDGRKITGMIHGQGRFFEQSAADPDLERIVGVPIRTSHLAALLMGRIPVIDYHSATLEPTADGCCLKLALRRWWHLCQAVYMDRKTDEPARVEAFDIGGALIYGAAFEQMQTVGRYRIPRILILSGGGASLRLTASRSWVDVAVSSKVFVVTPTP